MLEQFPDFAEMREYLDPKTKMFAKTAHRWWTLRVSTTVRVRRSNDDCSMLHGVTHVIRKLNVTLAVVMENPTFGSQDMPSARCCYLQMPCRCLEWYQTSCCKVSCTVRIPWWHYSNLCNASKDTYQLRHTITTGHGDSV